MLMNTIINYIRNKKMANKMIITTIANEIH